MHTLRGRWALACVGLALALVLRPPTSSRVAAAPASVPAETPQPDLVKRLPARFGTDKTLTVAAGLGSPPDDFRNEQGEIAGWEIDILRAASQSLGLTLDVRPTTFDSLIPGLQAKRFEAATGQIGVTEIREKVVDMIGTLLGNELFAARADSDITVKSLDDICGRTVATTRGSREYEFAQTEQPKCREAGKPPINMLTFTDGASAADALMSERADLFWVGSTAISYFVGQSGGRAKVVGSYTDLSYIGIALPKDSELSPVLQAAVQHLIDDGTYAKIVQKWGLQGGAIKHAPLNPKGVAT